jgi:hypothetical protein
MKFRRNLLEVTIFDIKDIMVNMENCLDRTTLHYTSQLVIKKKLFQHKIIT